MAAGGEWAPPETPQGHAGEGMTAAAGSWALGGYFREVLRQQGLLLDWVLSEEGDSMTQCLTKCYTEGRRLRKS